MPALSVGVIRDALFTYLTILSKPRPVVPSTLIANVHFASTILSLQEILLGGGPAGAG